MTEEFSLSELARTVWQRKGMVAIIIAACVIMAGVITLFMPKIYRAQTSVFFPEPRETTLTAALGAFGQNPTLAPALGTLAGAPGAAMLCKAITESDSVRTEICRLHDLQRHYHTHSLQGAAAALRNATWVNVTTEGLLVIGVDTTDPQLSADVANSYSRVVKRRYRESTLARANQERQFLEARVVEADRDLRRAEDELKAYQERAGAVLTPAEAPPILQKLADLRVEQAQAEVEVEAIRQRHADALRQLERLAADGETEPGKRSVYTVPWQLSSETTSDNPDIAELSARLVSLEVELAAARHNLTEEHPDLKRLLTQVEETRARLAHEARKTITAQTRTRSPVYAAALEDLVILETTLFGQQAQAQGLTQLVRKMEAQAETLPERLQRYSRLDREVRAREAVYTTLGSQLEAAKLKELQEEPVFEVLDEAVPPERHARPKLLVNLVVALIVGAFVAAAAAAALGPRQSKSSA